VGPKLESCKLCPARNKEWVIRRTATGLSRSCRDGCGDHVSRCTLSNVKYCVGPQCRQRGVVRGGDESAERPARSGASWQDGQVSRREREEQAGRHGKRREPPRGNAHTGADLAARMSLRTARAGHHRRDADMGSAFRPAPDLPGAPGGMECRWRAVRSAQLPAGDLAGLSRRENDLYRSPLHRRRQRRHHRRRDSHLRRRPAGVPRGRPRRATGTAPGRSAPAPAP
jgi:hypothetical protein